MTTVLRPRARRLLSKGKLTDVSGYGKAKIAALSPRAHARPCQLTAGFGCHDADSDVASVFLCRQGTNVLCVMTMAWNARIRFHERPDFMAVWMT